MNIKEYISSGIIESYVLGLALPGDKTEFENLCIQHPEIVSARNDFEIALERQLTAGSLTPPVVVKERLMSVLRSGVSSNDANILSMDNSNQTRNSSPMRWVTAASVILLLGAAYFAYDFYNKNQKLESSQKELQTKVTQMEDDKKWMDEVQTMMSNPNVAVVNLVGTTPAKASANVYWDTTASNVYLVVKNMPQLPNEKQYQLWSLIKGQEGLQPTSMGLFDVGKD
ncbi:MAG TPA: anti-sigma factor, partial [Chitinophagaceae bacterium]